MRLTNFCVSSLLLAPMASLFEQHCDHHVDEQRHSRKNNKETDNQKCPAHDFYDTHERTRKLGSGNTYFQLRPAPSAAGKRSF